MVKGTVFFDYDGTLHDCMRLYGPAFRSAYAWLVEGGYAQPREFADEWIAQWLGWTVRDMWNAFMPGLSEAVWKEASLIVGREMDDLLDAGQGALFAGVPEMLQKVRAMGFEAAFLSNCGEGYRDRHRRAFGLDRWISAYYCAGEFPGMAKWEIYRAVADRHAGPRIMVGDRFHDIEVAVKASIPAIGCAYGYGSESELADADVVVYDPSEIPQAIERLTA